MTSITSFDYRACGQAQTTTAGLSVGVVDNVADFAAMRDEWNELVASSKSDCVFLTWEWLHTWWLHLGRGKRLFIVTVRSGSRLVAIAPLTVRRVWAGLVALSLLEFLGTGSAGSDYLDFIVRSDAKDNIVDTIVSFIATTGYAMRLSNVSERSAVAKEVSQHLTVRGWACDEVPLYTCPFINLSGATWDSYLGSLGSNHRYNFRRRFRNLERDFTVRFADASSENERQEALRQLVSLHQMRWNTRGGSDAFNNADVISFHQDIAQLTGGLGWLRLFRLELNGQAAAAIYGFSYRGTFYFYQSGFDPSFERHSIGLVAMGLAIRSTIEEGSAEYDLLHGDETYKFLWAKESRPLVQLDLYPPGSMGLVHRNFTRSLVAAKRVIRRLLTRENG